MFSVRLNSLTRLSCQALEQHKSHRYRMRNLSLECAKEKEKMEQILSRLRKECAIPVWDAWQYSEIERDDVRQVRFREIREIASKRRLRELRELMSEGIYVAYINRWHVQIGPLHIWIAAGRWMNDATGVRGKLNCTSIRKLITVEAPEVINGSINFYRTI
jgi:hypothetical protein